LARSGVQQLSVLSWPDGATVIVDSRAIGITPFTGDMAPGKHRVLVSLRGYRDEVSDIQLALSAPGEAQFILKPETDQPATLRTASVAFPDADRPVAERRFGAVPWVVAGAGVVGLGSALGFELARRSEESAARRPGTSQVELQADNQAIRRDRITARVLLGAGTALLATGTVLLYFNDATPASPRVSVNCFVVGCSAQAKGHF
jgi:hypothetical protein